MPSRKAALVTGGATGIGRSAVLALARAGFDVAVNYSSSETAARETAAEAEKLGARTLLVRCDVSDETGVRAMLRAVEEKFQRLDVLVNNAGTTASWKPKDLETLSLEEWDRVFAVNVRGLFQVTRAAVPLLRKGEKPCVVNTASIVGLRPGPQPLPYAASKAAVVNLTKTLAWNLGPEIRVNAVAPGWMEGDWMKRMLKDKYDDLMGKRAKATPLKRVVTADDVAETMMSLIQSNRFVTGEVVVIDGGFTGFDLTCCRAWCRSRRNSRSATARRDTGRTSRSPKNFPPCFGRFQDRIALVDGERRYTYGEIDELSDNLALNLLELGLKPLDRVVPTLPNIAEFVLLYFALQKIGAIPIAALVDAPLRRNQPVRAALGATACVYPERQGDFAFEPMIRRVQAENPHARASAFRSPRLQAPASSHEAAPAAERAEEDPRSIRPTRASSSFRAAPPASRS